jgi:Zn-dependent M32 family carboxypeptidase
LPTGSALVFRLHRRSIPELHYWQYFICAVLCGALKAHPGIPQEIASGEFGTLHTWLRDNLYRHGSKFVPKDLVKRATRETMTIRPYLGYLRAKYGALYRLPANG